MNKLRIENLSDAVFAIVFTLLVIEIRVPMLDNSVFSEKALWMELRHLTPLFFAYFLSFTILISYWFIHNFLFSILAKNLNRHLTTINFIFLAFVSLIPFSSSLLGEFSQSKIAILVYSLNIAFLAVLSYLIREYIIHTPSIENPKLVEVNLTKEDLLYGTVRLIVATLVVFWQ
jgi:uncharacterized membrane protein